MFVHHLTPKDDILKQLRKGSLFKRRKELIATHPAVRTVTWNVLLSQPFKSIATKRGWKDPIVPLTHLTKGIVLLYEYLTPRVAAEVLYEGAIPILIDLIDIEEDIKALKSSVVDIQTRLIFSVIASLSRHHAHHGLTFDVRELIGSFDLPETYKKTLIVLAESHARFDGFTVDTLFKK